MRGWVAAAFATGAGLILIVAVGAVGRAGDRATKNGARVAASLYEVQGVTDADVARLLDGRVEMRAVREGGSGPGAYAYEAGSLEPVAWIAVTAADRNGSWPRLPTILALLGLLLISAWAIARRPFPPPPRYPAAIALLSAALLALVAITARQWAHYELEDLSAAHLARGLRAAETALAAGADQGRAARVAGLPWATATALDTPGQLWTMPRDVGAAIAATPGIRTTPTYTVEAGGATYHGGSTQLAPQPLAAGAVTPDPAVAPTPAPPIPDTLHLVFLGYEETASPAIALAAAALGSVLLVSLVLFLLPLSARPRALRRTLAAWGFVAPAATLLLVFTFGPLLFSLWISLHEWHLVDPAHPFTGLANYRGLLADGSWWSAIRNTVVFTVHVPFAMAVALALALLTRGSRRAVRWARLALFLPSITSVVAIAVVWKWLLNDGYGLLNRALEGVGLDSVPWLTSPDTALASLMAISVWMVVGYQMVVFQAGLAAIPRDWYDAARVDGAGPLQRFRHITLPGLRHTLFFVLVTSVIGSFQVFGLVYVMTEGGPLGATDVAVYHIYREAWEFLRFGNAAAMSWILFAVVFAATWLHFRFLEGRRAHA
ncbi:MAG: sugar ABC transporter permease [Gemmatimonadota bacterium]|nr:sugar ABC transporter permease [Gemmatimonadota bacterium]